MAVPKLLNSEVGGAATGELNRPPLLPPPPSLEKPKQSELVAGMPVPKRYPPVDGEEAAELAALARSLERSRLRRAMTTCQWFLTALSVRPGKWRAMSAHLLPWARWALSSRSSSSSVKGRLLIRGSSWLNHRSRQLLPWQY